MVLWAKGALAADDPERREPSKDAPGGQVFAWTSRAAAKGATEGLRYTWCLPKDMQQDKPYDMIVICHGTGLDYRWGSANYKPGVFRPGDIVICPDGTSAGGGAADDGTRVFLGQRADAMLFRDFLLEMTRTFPVDRIILYGHSQGSFFITYFAGEFPGLAEGIVAHASGAWTWSKTKGGIQRIPIAFMHGTRDPVVPYGQSVGARDAYAEEGHGMLLLRRLPLYNHWPNGDRASECIDWCLGMKTPDAAEAIARAEAMLRVKPKDEYGYECAPPYGAARLVLLRVVQAGQAEEEGGVGAKPSADAPRGARPVDEATEKQKKRAQRLLDRIDAEGGKHVATLKQSVKTRDDLALMSSGAEGNSWLGHLVSVREDFRGVDSVETYLNEIGWAEVRVAHEEAAEPMRMMWYSAGKEPDKLRAAVEALPNCFLVEALPFDLVEQTRDWRQRAGELEISDELVKKQEIVEEWDRAWRRGLDAYAAIWKEWK
jgi:predicted esterase